MMMDSLSSLEPNFRKRKLADNNIRVNDLTSMLMFVMKHTLLHDLVIVIKVQEMVKKVL